MDKATKMDTVDKCRDDPRIDTVLKKCLMAVCTDHRIAFQFIRELQQEVYGDRGGGQTCDNDGGNHDGGMYDADWL